MTDFICPECGHTKNKVTNTKVTFKGDGITRYRVCATCGAKWMTRETTAVVEGKHRTGPPRKYRALLALYEDFDALLRQAGLLP